MNINVVNIDYLIRAAILAVSPVGGWGAIPGRGVE